MSFSAIKGQDRPIGIIREYIKQTRVGRGYLFTGPEGVGKRLAAKTFAKALNCECQDSDPCDQCASCLKIEGAQHPDVHSIGESGIDSSASVKIEDIRQLQKEANLRPYEGRQKIFIIDNAHNLTPEAGNALLKVLEEPPKDSSIILISAKAALLFKTIISRCQIVKFYPMERPELSGMLTRDYGLSNDFAHFLAFFSEGRIGQALRLKDTDIFAKKNTVIDGFCIGRKSVSGAMGDETRQGMRGILNILAVWFRDVYLLKAGMPDTELINLDRKQDLLRAAAGYSFAGLDNILNFISDSLLRIEQNVNSKLLLSNLKWSLNCIN